MKLQMVIVSRVNGYERQRSNTIFTNLGYTTELVGVAGFWGKRSRSNGPIQ